MNFATSPLLAVISGEADDVDDKSEGEEVLATCVGALALFRIDGVPGTTSISDSIVWPLQPISMNSVREVNGNPVAVRSASNSRYAVKYSVSKKKGFKISYYSRA